MPRYILKFATPLGPRYMEWSTIVDAPVTYGLTLEQFEKHYRKEYGESGMRHEYPERMARVETKGTSSMLHDSADAVIGFNRAGVGESCATKAEIVEWYCVKRKEPK